MNHVLTRDRLFQIIEEEKEKLKNQIEEDKCKTNKVSVGSDIGALSPGLKVCDEKSGLVYKIFRVHSSDVSESDGSKNEKGVSLKTPEGEVFFVNEKDFQKNYRVE